MVLEVAGLVGEAKEGEGPEQGGALDELCEQDGEEIRAANGEREGFQQKMRPRGRCFLGKIVGVGFLQAVVSGFGSERCERSPVGKVSAFCKMAEEGAFALV